MTTPSIDVATLRDRRVAGEDLVILDVREPTELLRAAIPDVLAIPMAQIPARRDEIPRDRVLVVMCHHGGRSERVTQFLRAQGFDHAVNLAGGIDAWSREIDPTIPRYL